MSAGVCDHYYPSTQASPVDCKCLIDDLGEVKKTSGTYYHRISGDAGISGDDGYYSKKVLISFI